MTTYFQELDRQIEASSTVVVRGLPLDVGADHPLRAKGYSPILSPTCVCVTEPCPCDDCGGVIVWLPDGGVRNRNATSLKSRSGEALHEFHVMRDADVVVENFTKRKAESLTMRARAMGPHGAKLPGGPRGGAPLGKLGKPLAMRSVVCGGDNVLYYVVEGSDGSGGTLFEYIAIGSCEVTSS